MILPKISSPTIKIIPPQTSPPGAGPKYELGIEPPLLSSAAFYYPRIKEIERALYEEILKYPQDITVIREEFKKLIPGGVALEHTEIKCECVIDCTGSKRAVLKATNAIEIPDKEKSLFQEIESVKSIEKNMLLRSGKIDNLNKFFPIIRTDFHGRVKDELEDNNASAILKLEELKVKYGLDGNTIPYRKIHKFRKEKEKVIIYMAKPDHVPDDKVDEFVLDVLRVHAGDDFNFIKKENDSKKYGKKPRNQSFFIEPKKSNIMYWKLPGYPIIFPIGDSQVDPDFRTGTGLQNSIARASYFVSCMKGCEFDLEKFNYQSYEKGIQPLIQAQENREITFYQGRSNAISPEKNNLRNAYFSFKQGFNPALTELTEPVYVSLKKMFIVSLVPDSIWDKYYPDAKILLNKIASDFEQNSVMAKFFSCLHGFNRSNFPDFEKARIIYNGLMQEAKEIEHNAETKVAAPSLKRG